MNTFLRNAEYYGMTEQFDKLYADSKNNKTFHKLYNLVISKENILLAYRTIKSNKGSKTAGADRENINDLKGLTEENLVNEIRDCLSKYKPGYVKRVLIPKPNGKQRPLGIPTIKDRLIQQCFKQILEPILEAKFFKHSYGFRPFRSTRHAMARVQHLVNTAHFHYVVDVDIEGFFDNVNHKLLMKQLWNLGIRDLQVLAIIKKMLKAPILGIGIPAKGTPQGGILSPLLANVVLNDLDHWVAGQWENFKPRHEYAEKARYPALRKTKLKQGFIIRYADDFKIMAKTYKEAWRWYHAVRDYLSNRLKLRISPEKSKVINLRRRRSEFLGFEIKAITKGKKIVARTFVSKKSKQRISNSIKEQIETVRKRPNNLTAHRLNATILGVHNYFRYATNVSKDFADIYYRLARRMKRRLNKCSIYKKPYGKIYKSYKENYSLGYRTFKVMDTWIFPICDVSLTINMCFKQGISPYTPSGRSLLHKNLKDHVKSEIHKLMQSRIPNGTAEYLDNRLSRYSMNRGKCEVTRIFLQAHEVHCHHVIPRSNGGCDSYNNLSIVHHDIHRLIHATKSNTIDKLVSQFNLTKGQILKINLLRKKCNLNPIVL
ncbi:group II intron reverse transcriptase/maturase [Bacillus sp. 4048]|uniref:group II intron reverse transcriptase/maturase n=1 Tax=Bacillus TaxID=1386 RepID=UPI0008FDC158|nr:MULTISPECIES: group II intron reverse transcriptase/maturase [Bacillus]OJD44165.1 group II intron reverse transcriptase/maturase [Bacillus sp. 4048]TCD26597.1 group II intron reverse transcriptase/maturase [Bacillus wiedmannii]